MMERESGEGRRDEEQDDNDGVNKCGCKKRGNKREEKVREGTETRENVEVMDKLMSPPDVYLWI